MFKNFRQKRPGLIYEKVSRSSSEDGSISEEAQGFLTLDCRELVPQKSRKLKILAIVSFVLSGLLNISLLSFIGYQHAHRGPSSPVFPELVYSPAQDIIKYEAKVFSSGFGDQKTKYMGDSYEADAEWMKLYPRTVVRIPKSQADRLVNKSIPIAGDEDHFPVLISAFHSMHCLDSIRHLYWGHDKNADADPVVNERILKKHHIDHCFDSLRQSIMCAADVSPVPYNWVPSMGLALGSLGVPHTCRNYDDLVQWSLAPERDITGWDWSIKPSTIP